MAKFKLNLDVNSVVRNVMLVLSVVFLIVLGAVLWQQSRTQYLTLAAGDSSGDSYVLSSALKTVVERHYPKIRIRLVETGGTVENLAMLEAGRAQLATAQADVLPGPSARMMAVLFDDAFQLMVPRSSQIQHFVDLRGTRIALARSGGQFQSFLRVAEHFGLHEADFVFVGTNDQTADEAFLSGQADAIFRVRAIGNPSIRELVLTNKVRFLPIEHAVAMKINHPAFNAAVIPEGAYLGNPSVPAEDLSTISVHRTFLARDNVNASAIQAITGVLMERQQELMQEIPSNLAGARLLLAQVRRPDPQTGFGPPLHPGALNYYEKDKPSFLQANADFVGLIITTGFMVASWIWQLNRWMEKQQKNAADQYSNRVVALIGTAQEASSMESLQLIWRDLLAILAEAVRALDDEKISEESFHSFRAILQIGMDVTRERRAVLSSSAAGIGLVPALE
jgi:uncharacterized protein